MRKAYSYLRFSTPEQAKGDSHRRQSELARDYASRHDLDLDDHLTFHDLGVSAFRGANAETGRLGQFRQAVEQGLVAPGSVLLVESLDRISRQAARKALRVLEDICEAGVSVVTLSDGREYDRETLDRDPTTLIIAILTFIRANEESETKSRRLKASWSGRRAKAATTPITSRGPAWLKLADDRSAWEVIEDRAEVVRRIFTLAAAGAGENAIASTLNRDRVATWGDNGRAPAVMWHKSYVSKLLASRAAIGTLVPFTMVHEGGRKTRQAVTPVAGYYPAVVSDALWTAVQALKRTASPLRGRHAGKPLQNLFGGLARCSHCGRAMTRVTKGSSTKAGAPKLICTGAKTGAGCDYVGVPLDAIEQALVRDFRVLANGGPSGKVWNAGVREALQNNEKRADLIESRINFLLTEDTQFSVDQTWSMIFTLSNEKKDLIEERENLHNLARMMAEPDVKSNLNIVETCAAGSGDKLAGNIALRQLFEKVVVDVKGGRVTFHWKTGESTELRFHIEAPVTRQAAQAKRQRRTPTGRFQPRAA